ncbi:MAG: TrkH family potassium uptake protein [Bacteroidales bacterium]
MSSTTLKRLAFISKIAGIELLIITGGFIVSLLVALDFHESLYPFILSGLITLSPGSLLLLTGTKRSYTIKKRDAYLTVSISWLILGFIGSLPFIVSHAIPSVLDALFESFSGFTTTGASILDDIESLPKSILFWRSLTHWIGGIGIIILVIIVLPSLKISGYHLFSVESSLQEKIKPRVKSIGKSLFAVYLFLTAFEFLLLKAGNMNWFESACHSFGTIATGGFSPKSDSIAGYSDYIQYVIMVFMLLSGINFTVHYYLLTGRVSKIGQNEELKFYLKVIALFGTIITIILMSYSGLPFGEAFRKGWFQVVSIITCTGFATDDYMVWPVSAWVLLFFAMFLGGSTGSTAGGIKMARYLILIKNIRQFYIRALNPHVVYPIKLNKNVISQEMNQSILVFITTYFIVFVIGSALLMSTGLSLATSAGSAATCMAGIGPGLEATGPASNYAHIPGIAKAILIALMLIGRLEIFSVLVLFTRSYWKP